MGGFELTTPSKMKSGAWFSEDRQWRYTLWRIWDKEKPSIAFIGLNPSTADETTDDPTVRRCIRFAQKWGYGSMWMLNLFGLRSTDPKMLYEHDDPVGRDNREAVYNICLVMEKVVLCWGNHGAHLKEGWRLVEQLKKEGYGDKLWAFGVTKQGQPKHPLYLPNDTKLIKA